VQMKQGKITPEPKAVAGTPASGSLSLTGQATFAR